VGGPARSRKPQIRAVQPVAQRVRRRAPGAGKAA